MGYTKIMRLFFSCIACLVVLETAAQQIENLEATFDKDKGKVVIHYDLIGGNPNGKYNVDLYSSHNTYLNPLNLVAGDVGKRISGGPNKEILWEAGKELGTFQGELTFKVKVEVLPLPFEFISPAMSSSVRRGKSTNVQWEGGTPGQTIKLEAYRGTERVAEVAETKNTGEYSWKVPGDLAKGSGYTLRILGGDQSVNGRAFSVKAKMPLLLKLSPLIIGAAIIPFLGGSGGGETPPASEQLAAAPNPN